MTDQAKPIHLPFTVAVDSREKAPYTFTGLRADAAQKNRPLAVAWEYRTLKSGDYSIVGHEAEIAIERKSLADLYGTLGQNRERFEAEHERLAAMGAGRAFVVIEADWPTILQRPPAESRLNPKTVFRTAVSWQLRYGVPWLALGDRRLCEHFVFRTLEKFAEQTKKAAKPLTTKAAPLMLDGSPDDRAAEAMELADEILSAALDLPGAAWDFACGVIETTKSIRAQVERNDSVTDKQFTALENMQAGVAGWQR